MELPRDIWEYILGLRKNMMAVDLVKRAVSIPLLGNVFCTNKFYLLRNAFHSLEETDRKMYRTDYEYLHACHDVWYRHFN